jgi:hypothetical protein
MTMIVKMVDTDGVPLELPEGLRVVLVAAGNELAEGIAAGDGSYSFDVEPRPGLAVRVEPVTPGA